MFINRERKFKLFVNILGYSVYIALLEINIYYTHVQEENLQKEFDVTMRIAEIIYVIDKHYMINVTVQ